MAKATTANEISPLKGFSSLMEESDWWDERSIEELIAMSEPDDEDSEFVDARPKKAISLRLTETMITEAKRIATELGLGYQTLFRMWLMDGLRRHHLRQLAERHRLGAPEAKSAATRTRRPRHAAPTPRPRSGRGVGSETRG